MKRLSIIISCVLLGTLASSCGSSLYVAARCTEENKNKVVPVYNATLRDIEFIKETWTNRPGHDYVLPPWLDSSLNTLCGIIDIPISIIFDTVTLPFQALDYWIRKDQIKKSNESLQPTA